MKMIPAQKRSKKQRDLETMKKFTFSGTFFFKNGSSNIDFKIT